MNAAEIMTELEAMGNPGIKKKILNHGVKEPFFGVKIEHLKTIEKKVKTDYQLAKDLYATGIAVALFLAGLIADDPKMTKADLQAWIKAAVSNNISEYTVPWVAAGSPFGFELALEWIDSIEAYIAAAGWNTLSSWVTLKPNGDLNIAAIRSLLQRVVKSINSSPNRVIYTMNGFIIAVGSYVAPLSDEAIAAANQVGTVVVDMTGTSCKVPDAAAYIEKEI